MSTTTAEPAMQRQAPRRLPRIDGRSSAGKRLRVLLRELLATIPNASPAQVALAQRCCSLRYACEVQEQMMASGDDRFDHDAYLRTCTAWHRMSRHLTGSTPPKGTPHTLEELYGDLRPDPNAPRPRRFVAAVLDSDDSQVRRDRALFDTPGLHVNRKRDAALARLHPKPSRRNIARRKIKGAKS